MQQRVVSLLNGTNPRAWRIPLHLAFRKPQRDHAWLALGGAGRLSAANRMSLPATSALVMPGRGERVVIGIGEFAVTTAADAEIVTHALGSCVAVRSGTR